MLNLEELQEKITTGEFLFSQHAIEESSKDMVEDDAIAHAIRHGEIIESYPNDPRGESCLVNGLHQLKEEKRSHKMNKCYFCNSDEIHEKYVDYSFWWGAMLIVFREVPALVCTSCGEKYFRPEISRRMKNLAKEINDGKRKYKKITVPTVKFADEVIA